MDSGGGGEANSSGSPEKNKNHSGCTSVLGVWGRGRVGNFFQSEKSPNWI